MVRLWDAVAGSARGAYKGHSGAVHMVAFSPDSQLVASGSEDGIVKLWDVATRSVRSTLKGHSAQSFSLFSQDSAYVSTQPEQFETRAWPL
jgi:WD40 repeat protein